MTIPTLSDNRTTYSRHKKHQQRLKQPLIIPPLPGRQVDLLTFSPMKSSGPLLTMIGLAFIAGWFWIIYTAWTPLVYLGVIIFIFIFWVQKNFIKLWILLTALAQAHDITFPSSWIDGQS